MSDSSIEIIDRLLAVIEIDLLPLTHETTADGNKVFGAAVLAKRTLKCVVAGVNAETKNPLLHGEIACLNRYWALPTEARTAPTDSLFLSTHEPCSMCLSAITWSGFDNFYYLFSYEDSKDAFNIPHDLNILSQVFGVVDGAYRPVNDYWRSYSIPELIAGLPDGNERAGYLRRVEAIKQAYGTASTAYQASKTANKIPLA